MAGHQAASPQRGGGEGGPEGSGEKRQDRVGFCRRKDKLCSWCSVEHNRLMECVSMDNPPHPRDPQSGGSMEATARSRAFSKLARPSAPMAGFTGRHDNKNTGVRYKYS